MKLQIHWKILTIVLTQLFLSSAYANTADFTMIVIEVESKSESTGGGSGNSRSSSALIERIIENGDSSIEIEYTFPDVEIPGVEAWKLPARVSIAPGRSITLLNKAEIQNRLLKFLKKNPSLKDYCEQTIFTWTATTIHCEADHVVDFISAYNLHIDVIDEGSMYEEPGVIQAAALKLKTVTENKMIYETDLVLDPDYLQAEHEKSLATTAQITGSTIESIYNSLYKLSENQTPLFSGMRTVEIEKSLTGLIVKLQRETTTTIKGGAGFKQTQFIKEIIERRPVQ